MNIASNAVKFTEEGRVTISTSLVKPDQLALPVPAALGDTRLVGIHAVDENADGSVLPGKKTGTEITAQPDDAIDLMHH